MQSPSTAHQFLFHPESKCWNLIACCEETLKFCLLEGKHLCSAVGFFSFLSYLCGTWEFAQVCFRVVFVLRHWFIGWVVAAVVDKKRY